MATTAYTAYIPDIQVYARGCPAPVIIDAIQKTGTAFFGDTLAYRVWLPAFDLVLNTTSYTLNGQVAINGTLTTLLPAQTEMIEVMEAYCNGAPITVCTHQEFFAQDPQWPSKTGTYAQYYTQINPRSSFDIIPMPSATVVQTINLQLAINPQNNATQMDAMLFDQWKSAYVNGALSRVLRMKETPWFDLQEADKRQGMYESLEVAAKTYAEKGNTRRDINVQMLRWV